MRIGNLLAVLLLTAAAARGAGAQTAAAALAAIERERGADLSTRLVEISGQRGEPQPQAWIFRFNDPGARGGIREITVQGAQIAAERTPIRASVGSGAMVGTGDLPTLPVNALNLDSRAVFQVANQAAARQGLGFHWLDYSLRPDTQTALPSWFLVFIDVFGARVAEMTLDAKSLAVVQPLQVDPGVNAQINANAAPAAGVSTGGTSVSATASMHPLRWIERSLDTVWTARGKVHESFFGGIQSARDWLAGAGPNPPLNAAGGN